MRHSLTFKTLFLLFVSASLFITFIVYGSKHSFSKGYNDLILEDINSIMESISPSIALNLSYGFKDAVVEIAKNQLKNDKILFLEITSKNLKKNISINKTPFSLDELKSQKHFISTTTLYDPVSSEKLGKLTLVYSNRTYKKNMHNFYKWFGISVFAFSLSIALLGFLLYKSLKNLTILAQLFKEFDPNRPREFTFNIKTNDEIGIINNAANFMVKKLIKYINDKKALNETILQKEAHLKDAQRIARVGSWEYNVSEKKLLLSDEIYRILGIKANNKMTWKHFLHYISQNDRSKVVKTFKKAIKNGSNFNLQYSLSLPAKEAIYVQTKGKVRKKANGQIKITAVTMDITKDIQNQKTIEKLAYYDTLTGLANRTLLEDRMYKAIQTAKRENKNLAVLFLDLDHFKLINDTLGHGTGDELLVHISKILKSHLRESDTVSRLGGDEFVVLIPSISSIEYIKNIISNIQKSLQKKHYIGSHELFITTSIGVSIYPQHGNNTEELIKNADTAMYEAKNNGRNNYKIYSEDMGNYIDRQLSIEQDLIKAVKSKDEIEVYYQVKIDSLTNTISGAEALVRWKHPQKGIIYPDDFIYIAESTGIMIELGNIIIEKTISDIHEWNKMGILGLKIAINLSPRQFQDSNLTSFISSIIEKYNIDPHQLEFEITETLSMANMSNTLRILNDLKGIGVSIAIDDFGTGHSSLAYLKKFPVNTLKIDKSFIMDLTYNEEDLVIVRTIISMAHSLGFYTVAEGVETEEHVNILKNIDCDQLQGYHYSKPIPKEEFTKFIQGYMNR